MRRSVCCSQPRPQVLCNRANVFKWEDLEVFLTEKKDKPFQKYKKERDKAEAEMELQPPDAPGNAEESTVQATLRPQLDFVRRQLLAWDKNFSIIRRQRCSLRTFPLRTHLRRPRPGASAVEVFEARMALEKQLGKMGAACVALSLDTCAVQARVPPLRARSGSSRRSHLTFVVGRASEHRRRHGRLPVASRRPAACCGHKGSRACRPLGLVVA